MLIVVGGHARKVGKTSVICGIISCLHEWRWTAIKISPHDHAPSANPDTRRYLDAGAERSFLLRAPDAEWHGANTIVESTSALDTLAPDLALLVIDPSVQDFKPSAHRFLQRADAIVLTAPAAGFPLPADKPIFEAPPPDYKNPALIAAIRLKLPPPPADSISR